MCRQKSSFCLIAEWCWARRLEQWLEVIQHVKMTAEVEFVDNESVVPAPTFMSLSGNFTFVERGDMIPLSRQLLISTVRALGRRPRTQQTIVPCRLQYTCLSLGQVRRKCWQLYIFERMCSSILCVCVCERERVCVCVCVKMEGVIVMTATSLGFFTCSCTCVLFELDTLWEIRGMYIHNVIVCGSHILSVCVGAKSAYVWICTFIISCVLA